jgi:Frag1/DRAM/Sfk1 family
MRGYCTLYPTSEADPVLSYISDVGAFEFKPLFIAMGTTSVVTFDLAFVAERWLRHSGRLVHNTTRWQKVLAAGSIIFSIIGALGLILLTIFDVYHHKSLHDTFLALFMYAHAI